MLELLAESVDGSFQEDTSCWSNWLVLEKRLV